MTSLARRLKPRRIAAQLVVVVGVSVVLIQIIVAASFFLVRSYGHGDVIHVDALVRLLASLPAGEVRRARVAEMRRAFPELEIDLVRAMPPHALPLERGRGDRWPYGPLLDDIAPWVREIRGVPPVENDETPHLVLALDGGDWLLLDPQLPPVPPLPPFAGPLIGGIAFAGISSVLLALWAAHGLVRPLRSLAAAAREFDIEGEPRPLEDAGPEEVRVASRAFDAMRNRIRDLVEDRTRMLAAMGHDLRTPITRLRLRSEFVGEDSLREEFLRDLGMMNDMIEGALTYLREGRHGEKLALVDLAALIGTQCDRAADLGREVAYDGPGHLSWRLRPQAMNRALTNLIDNALKYGTTARVRLTTRSGAVEIVVEDDGPGIPAAERERMLSPFVRGDVSRNLNDAQGFGLGLAIARSVVEGHHGTIELGTAAMGGLSVRIVLQA